MFVYKPRQIPAHSLYSNKVSHQGVWKYNISKLYKAGITQNLNRPTSGHSYMSKDKHSANATEPWTTSSHQKDMKIQDFWEFNCFILTMWSGFFCREAAQEIFFCDSHILPERISSPRLPLQTPLMSNTNTLMSDKKAATESDMQFKHAPGFSSSNTLWLGSKKDVKGKPVSWLHCCFESYSFNHQEIWITVDHDYRVIR